MDSVPASRFTMEVAVRFTDVKGPTDEMLSNNIIRRGIPEGRRFSSRFPARQTWALNS